MELAERFERYLKPGPNVVPIAAGKGSVDSLDVLEQRLLEIRATGVPVRLRLDCPKELMLELATRLERRWEFDLAAEVLLAVGRVIAQERLDQYRAEVGDKQFNKFMKDCARERRQFSRGMRRAEREGRLLQFIESEFKQEVA